MLSTKRVSIPTKQKCMKTYLIHIEWDGDGRKETREIEAESKAEAKRMAYEEIHNPSINYGYSYWVEEKQQKKSNDKTF
jgi:hypothetical protein